MKEYSGAVFFVDILGVGALTQGKINITEDDFLAHRFSFKKDFSEHQFCAKLLVKFRRILTSVTEGKQKVKVAQLSDCAFIWSEDPHLVVNAAREIMWKAILAGMLCRGGLSYGQIVEPDKINTKLGMFICGGAVTDAVKLEEVGKGARVFIKPELVSELTAIQASAFTPRKNPIDCSVFDEFLWYKYPDHINQIHDNSARDNLTDIFKIIQAIALLRYSPKFRWNVSSLQGKLQVASTIDIISSETTAFSCGVDLNFECESIINALDNRSDKKYKDVFNLYKSEISYAMKN